MFSVVRDDYYNLWKNNIRLKSPSGPSIQTFGFYRKPSQESQEEEKKEVNAEKCHMSERVNLIWSEVKFDAIYSESCVCLISVLPCHIGYLSLSAPPPPSTPPRALLCSSSPPSHSVNVRRHLSVFCKKSLQERKNHRLVFIFGRPFI